jgi:signal transduction histidine kinase/ActR/RegA family two-component response regulator
MESHISHASSLKTNFHSGVMGCLAILQESDGKINTAEAKDVVNTAITSGNHMIRLLNEILDISKNQHLLHTSVRDHVIYQSLAFDTIDCMRSLASSRQIQLESSIEPKDDKVVVSIDRTKVIQIVTNIVNNAIKFTSEGNIAVNFRLVDSREDAVLPWMTSSTDHAGAVFSMREGEMLTTKESVAEQVAEFPSSPDQRWISISVVDSGCGMEPKELADMFSPYTQSSKGSSRAFKGTGLGLYICVSLCRQLSGFIACASTPDRGTTFHVGLPVELPKQGDTTTSDDSTYESSLLGEDILMRGPILIVDDNTVNVKILHRALQIDLRKANVEIDIHTTFGGKEAVQLYKEHHPSLCIIDYHMPATDGLAATKIIRQYENKNNLPPSCIVIYTADVTDETGKLILNSGANENMAKPPPKGSIKQLVQRLVLVDRTQHNVIS